MRISGVDVIVPVYGAGAALGRCAASLRRHTDLDRDRLLIVLDGPQDSETVAATRDFSEAPGVVVLENLRRQGFVASVNRGLKFSNRDVVLLNSDTLVTAGWVENLYAAAHSDRRIATATPFSNHATICSLPRFLAENTVPAGFDVDSFAALVEGCSTRAYPELPTGVGVCLFIKRCALDAVGLLDEEGFGLGYGEETEWCFRASRAGYRHVLDDSTYIFHEGQRSFGVSRARRLKAAHRAVVRRHPGYLSEIADFIRRDPLEPVRGRVLAALAPRRQEGPGKRGPGVVHVVHGWPPWAFGGTEIYARWLARRQVQSRDVSVYARIEDPDRRLGDVKEHFDHGIRVRLVVNNFAQRNPVSRNALHSSVLVRDFARFLDESRPDLIHFHHLAGHCASLVHVARRRGAAIVQQLQDWWPICNRVNLFHRSGCLCTGPSPSKCADCLPMTRLPGHALWNPVLYAGRAVMLRTLMTKVDALVMGSRFIHDTYRHWGFRPSGVPVHVVRYGIESGGDSKPERRELRPGAGVRFGYLGTLLPHKGVHVAVQAFEGIDPDRATLDVWGRFGSDPLYHELVTALARSAPAVRLHGGFEEEERHRILEELDVLIVPSLGLESFGIAAQEAIAAGLPVLASARGALLELFESPKQGAFFRPGDVQDLRSWVLKLSDRPDQIRRWRAALPAVKGMERHAEEIDRIYETLVPWAVDGG